MGKQIEKAFFVVVVVGGGGGRGGVAPTMLWKRGKLDSSF